MTIICNTTHDYINYIMTQRNSYIIYIFFYIIKFYGQKRNIYAEFHVLLIAKEWQKKKEKKEEEAYYFNKQNASSCTLIKKNI